MSGWHGRRVLVTGHTGFKGAWLTLWLQRLGAEVAGLALAPDDERAAFAALAPWPGLDDCTADVRDAGAVASRVRDVAPDVVLHLAAQALVRAAYDDPAGTYATNVLGTAHVLEAARATPSVRAVVVVTSDKVYRQGGTARPFREDDPLGGHDPYSASKACAELVVAEWARRPGAPRVATARAGNVIGGGDRGVDRLLPDLVRSAESGAPAAIRFPDATRPWQHVLDPLAGYLLLAERLLGESPAPPAANFGPTGASTPVRDVATRFVEALGAGSWEHAGGDHPAEAPTLALDASLAAASLGWQPRLPLDDALAWTAEWYRAQLDGADVRTLTLAQIEQFEELAMSERGTSERIIDIAPGLGRGPRNEGLA